MKKLMLSVLCLMFALSAAIALVGCEKGSGGSGSDGSGSGSGDGGHTHSFTVQNTEQAYIASAATCTQAATYYYSCSCGEKGEITFAYGSALGHEFGDWLVVTPATAENEGLQRRTCSRCSEKEEQTIAKITHVHSYSGAVIAPTCTERGYTLYSCTCGDTYKDDFTNALSHSFTNYVSDNNATCEQDGTKTAKCGRCGVTDTIADVGSKKAHSFDKQEVTKEYLKVAATCTAPATYYYSCSGCGEKGEETFAYGNALGHDFVEHEAKAPTCTQIGWDAYVTCTRCDYTTYIEMPALGHDFVEHEAKAPSCTQIGWDAYVTCTRCDYTTYIEMPALGHDLVEYEAKEATCTEIGWDVYETCTRCGYTTYEEMPALGHDFVDGVCTRCGKTNLNPTEGLEYTLNSDGVSYSCTGIGTATAKDIVIAKEYSDLPVTAIGWSAFKNCSGLTSVTIGNSVTSIGNYAFYNCSGLTSVTIGNSVTSIGYDAFRDCYKLFEVINNSEMNITKGSSYYGEIGYYALNVKKGGGSEIVNKEGYLFYTYNDVNYLLGYSGTEKDLTLPQNYNGQNYEIYKKAFAYCSGLTSVTIPDSVTSIGGGAFAYCSGLTSVTIGNSVTSIGYEAFYNCSGLTSVTIGTGVTSIGNSAFNYCYKLVEVINNSSLNITKGSSDYGYIGYYALNVKKGGSSEIVYKDGYLFYTYNDVNFLLGYSGTEKDLTFPQSYNGQNYEIYKYAFYNCRWLTSVTILDSVTSIGDYAFASCRWLTSITIPDSVTSIGNFAFQGCSGLTSVTIGDSVTSIGHYAFKGCGGLTSVTIGNSVTSIGHYAFEDCSGLSSVTIPDSVTEIGFSAFDGCSGLKTVYYKGTKMEKNNIFIDSDGNTALNSATWYYYSETEPALNAAGTGYDDNYWHYDAAGEPDIWKKQ